jgi:hypothetical protein
VARFVTIGYGDRAGYDRTDPAIRDAAHQRDACLHASGALMGRDGQPVQVRNHNESCVDTSEGPFLRSDLQSRDSWSSRPLISKRRSALSPRPLVLSHTVSSRCGLWN